MIEELIHEFTTESIESLTPQVTEKYLVELSGYAASLEEELGSLDMAEARTWVALRTQYPTNEEAKRHWKASIDGQKQTQIKHQLKAVDKIISACKHHLKRLEMQAFNQY